MSMADRWLSKAAELAQRFNNHYIQGVPLVELQADELRSFAPGKARPIWVCTSMEVCSRVVTTTLFVVIPGYDLVERLGRQRWLLGSTNEHVVFGRSSPSRRINSK